MLTSLLRHPTDRPPSTQGSRFWPTISDRDVVTATGLNQTSKSKSNKNSVLLKLENAVVLMSCFTHVFIAAMIMKSQTPSVTSSIGGQKKLHCQFAIDHKGPNFSLEWHKRGERVILFSHTSRTRQTEGRGVDLRDLASGDASYNLAYTKISNEGMYVCLVSVAPLSASLDINLRIEGEKVIKPGSSSKVVQ